jgi:hypothetical protein
MKAPIITLCSSANFYRKVVDVQEQLGFTVIIPSTATRMKESGDFDVSHYKTWFADANDYDKKAALMRGHFDEVTKADAILVLNEEKHGTPNYIGGNVLMEMALAFHLRKPIFIFNDIPEASPFIEEIRGMQPLLLKGDLSKFHATYHGLGSTANG